MERTHKMSTKAKKVVSVISGLTLITSIACLICFNFTRDLPKRTIIESILFRHDTNYSSRYSESAFRKVREGMTQGEAEELLGKTLRIIEDADGRIVRQIDCFCSREEISYPDLDRSSGAEATRRMWYYSLPGKRYDNWHVRALVLSRDGYVIEISDAFYID